MGAKNERRGSLVTLLLSPTSVLVPTILILVPTVLVLVPILYSRTGSVASSLRECAG
jgi:hypothetical protein